MTVKELKALLDTMPDRAVVIMVDSAYCGNQITDVKHRESNIIHDGVVELRANE